MKIETSELVLRYDGLRVRDRAAQSELVASLSRHGQQTAVAVVRASEPDPGFVLIDGYRRVEGLRELACDTVEAVVLEVSEAEALMATQGLEHGRERSALEQGWLLSELVAGHGLGQQQLAVRLGRSASWVSRRLGLVHVLPEAVQQAVRRGRIPPHAAEKSLLPLARANAALCERLVERLGPEPVSVRELERVVHALRAADAEQRQRIAEQPRLYLAAEQASEGEAPCDPLSELTDKLVRDLEVLEAVCLRARRRLGHGARAHERRVQRRLRQVREGFGLLSEQMNEEAQRDARSGHAGGDPTASPPGARQANDRQGGRSEPQVRAQGGA